MTAQTLLLNATFEPIHIIPWQRAMTLVYKNRVEIIAEHDEIGRSVTFTFKLPSVVRLLRYARIKRLEHVPFTRANIYARDGYTCQYCSQRFPTEELTFDHVVPAAAGGIKSWTNIVTACVDCNRRKDNRTPEQAGMTLLSTPQKPHRIAIMAVTIGLKKAPESWRDFLYWHGELSAE